GGAYVADFVRYGSDGQARRDQEMMEAGFLLVAKILGAIDEHGRQPWPGACLVSGKPNVREKHIPISTPATALHRGAEAGRGFVGRSHSGQGRQEILDGLARQ